MKKIINGKLYNTETARLIGDYEYSNSSDFNWVYEGLYVTKKGQYFLAGKGGANSKYGKSLGNNSYGGGSNIELLTENEAKEWAEDNLSTDEYTEEFEIEEG